MGGQDCVRPTVFYPAKLALGARKFSFVMDFIPHALPVPRGHWVLFEMQNGGRGGRLAVLCGADASMDVTWPLDVYSHTLRESRMFLPTNSHLV